MKAFVRQRAGWLIALLLIGGAVLAACAPNPNELIISPALGEQMVARAAGGEIVRAEPTPLPKLADLTPEQINAGLPDDLLAAMASANAANGEVLYQSQGCMGCHSLDPNVQMTGPTWHNLGNVAVSRVPGMSPAMYLDTSVVNPSAHVVTGYPDNIMPKNYGEILTIQDQADLIAFMLSQTQTAVTAPLRAVRRTADQGGCVAAHPPLFLSMPAHS
jgi:cytochrome c2